MRKYELTVLFHPDLEIDLEKPLDKVRELIKKNKGKITAEDNWGKKRLAYRINKEDFAVYVYFELELPAENVSTVDNNLNITDEVLRHLIVAHDPKRDEAEAKKKDKEQTEEDSEENKEE